MEEKFRIKEYNEGQEEDKEEKYRDKNKRYDDTEKRRTLILIQMRFKRTPSDPSLTDHFIPRTGEVARAGCSSDEAVWMTE